MDLQGKCTILAFVCDLHAKIFRTRFWETLESLHMISIISLSLDQSYIWVTAGKEGDVDI